MPGKDITLHITTITPEDSVLEAARLMHDLDVGALAVHDGEAIVGLVTDRDITLRAAGRGCAPRSVAVAEVMRWRGVDEPLDALLARGSARSPAPAQERAGVAG